MNPTITPQTNPELYRIQPVGAHEYYVPSKFSVGFQEDLEDAQRDARRMFFKVNHPESLTKDGKIDEAKYKAWLKDNGDQDEVRALNKAVDRAGAHLLFIPKGDAPAINTDAMWHTLDYAIFFAVLNFTVPTSPDNTNGQTTEAANGQPNPDTAIAATA